MRLYGGIEERVLAKGRFTDGCWEWNGCRSTAGYGRARVDGRYVWVHRAVMEWTLGRSLHRLEQVDHLCRNRACFRPSHLEIVTPAENTRRGRVAKLTPEQVDEMRARRANGETLASLGRFFGMHHSNVSRVCRGLRYDREHHAETRRANA